MNHQLLAEEGKAIRDPVWGYIHVPDPVLALIDTEDFQRLRNITQLGYVHLVYPGARHSRFEHSLGVYHLAKQFLTRLLDSDPPLVNTTSSGTAPTRAATNSRASSISFRAARPLA